MNLPDGSLAGAFAGRRGSPPVQARAPSPSKRQSGSMGRFSPAIPWPSEASTSVPTTLCQDRKRVKHHLLDVAEPRSCYSAASSVRQRFNAWQTWPAGARPASGGRHRTLFASPDSGPRGSAARNEPLRARLRTRITARGARPSRPAGASTSRRRPGSCRRMRSGSSRLESGSDRPSLPG